MPTVFPVVRKLARVNLITTGVTIPIKQSGNEEYEKGQSHYASHERELAQHTVAGKNGSGGKHANSGKRTGEEYAGQRCRRGSLVGDPSSQVVANGDAG